MTPNLIPQRLSPSARSGTQSKIAENIIREAKKVYNDQPLFKEIQSSTLIAVQNSPASRMPECFADICRIIKRNRKTWLADRLKEIEERRTIVPSNLIASDHCAERSLSHLEPGLKTMIDLIERTKVANCGPINYYFQHLLDKAGIPTLGVHATIPNEIRKGYCSDHLFLVTGLDPKGVDLHNPNSYGPNTAYLDVWGENGLFVPIKEGIERLKKTFNMKGKETFIFQPSDYHCNDSNGFKFPTFATVEQLPPRFRNP